MGASAVFVYKDPRNADRHITIKVRELPNGVIEVTLADQAGLKLESFLKMIERHESYAELDAWLPKQNFTK